MHALRDSVGPVFVESVVEESHHYLAEWLFVVTTWCRQSHSGSGAYNGSNAYFNIIKQPFSYLGVQTHP